MPFNPAQDSGGDIAGSSDAPDQFEGDSGLWVCCPAKYADFAEHVPTAGDGGVWAKATYPEASGHKGTLHLLISDPKTGEPRWAAHSRRGNPLRAKSLTPYIDLNDLAALGIDFDTRFCNNIPEEPLPVGYSPTYAAGYWDSQGKLHPFTAQLYIVSSTGISAATGTIDKSTGLEVKGAICPGIYNTEGAKDTTSGYARDGQWQRLADPNTVGGAEDPVIEYGHSSGPAQVRIDKDDYAFITIGYKAWIRTGEDKTDGIYAIPDEMAPGIYVSEGPVSTEVPGSWEIFDTSGTGGLQTRESGSSLDAAKNTVSIKETDIYFKTQGYKPWILKAALPEEGEDSNIDAWVQVAQLEYRNFHFNSHASSCFGTGISLIG